MVSDSRLSALSMTIESAKNGFKLHICAQHDFKYWRFHAPFINSLCDFILKKQAETGKIFRLSDFKMMEYDEFTAWRRLKILPNGKKLSDRTLYHQSIIIRRFFDFCFERGFIKNRWFDKIKDPKVREESGRALVSDMAIKQLLDAVDAFWSLSKNPTIRFHNADLREFFRLRMRTIVILGAATGIRPSEICALTVENYKSIQIINGVGEEHESSIIEVCMTKNKKIRTVILTRDAKSALDRWMRLRRALFSEEPIHFLFPTATGTKYAPETFRHQFRRIFKFSDNLEQFQFYDLRRRFATIMVHIDPRAAQEAMGHSDLRVTQRYLRPDLSKMAQAIEKSCLTNGFDGKKSKKKLLK